MPTITDLTDLDLAREISRTALVSQRYFSHSPGQDITTVQLVAEGWILAATGQHRQHERLVEEALRRASTSDAAGYEELIKALAAHDLSIDGLAESAAYRALVPGTFVVHDADDTVVGVVLPTSDTPQGLRASTELDAFDKTDTADQGKIPVRWYPEALPYERWEDWDVLKVINPTKVGITRLGE